MTADIPGVTTGAWDSGADHPSFDARHSRGIRYRTVSAEMTVPADAHIDSEAPAGADGSPGMQEAVHLWWDDGTRFTVTVHAATSSGDDGGLIEGMRSSLEDMGLDVREGDWSGYRTLVAGDGLALCVFCPGPRWVMQVKAYLPARRDESVLVDLRTVVEEAVIFRGSSAVPCGHVLDMAPLAEG